MGGRVALLPQPVLAECPHVWAYPLAPQGGKRDAQLAGVPCPVRRLGERRREQDLATSAGPAPHLSGHHSSRAHHCIPMPLGPCCWGGLRAQQRHIMAAQPSSGHQRASGHTRAGMCPGLSRDKAWLHQAGKTPQVWAQSGFVPGSLSEGAQWLIPRWPKKGPTASTPRLAPHGWHPTSTPAVCPLPAPGKEDSWCCRGWSLCFLGWGLSWGRGWWRGGRGPAEQGSLGPPAGLASSAGQAGSEELRGQGGSQVP